MPSLTLLKEPGISKLHELHLKLRELSSSTTDESQVSGMSADSNTILDALLELLGKNILRDEKSIKKYNKISYWSNPKNDADLSQEINMCAVFMVLHSRLANGASLCFDALSYKITSICLDFIKEFVEHKNKYLTVAGGGAVSVWETALSYFSPSASISRIVQDISNSAKDFMQMFELASQNDPDRRSFPGKMAEFRGLAYYNKLLDAQDALKNNLGRLLGEDGIEGGMEDPIKNLYGVYNAAVREVLEDFKSNKDSQQPIFNLSLMTEALTYGGHSLKEETEALSNTLTKNLNVKNAKGTLTDDTSDFNVKSSPIIRNKLGLYRNLVETYPGIKESYLNELLKAEKLSLYSLNKVVQKKGKRGSEEKEIDADQIKGIIFLVKNEFQYDEYVARLETLKALITGIRSWLQKDYFGKRINIHSSKREIAQEFLNEINLIYPLKKEDNTKSGEQDRCGTEMDDIEPYEFNKKLGQLLAVLWETINRHNKLLGQGAEDGTKLSPGELGRNLTETFNNVVELIKTASVYTTAEIFDGVITPEEFKALVTAKKSSESVLSATAAKTAETKKFTTKSFFYPTKSTPPSRTTERVIPNLPHK